MFWLKLKTQLWISLANSQCFFVDFIVKPSRLTSDDFEKCWWTFPLKTTVSQSNSLSLIITMLLIKLKLEKHPQIHWERHTVSLQSLVNICSKISCVAIQLIVSHHCHVGSGAMLVLEPTGEQPCSWWHFQSLWKRWSSWPNEVMKKKSNCKWRLVFDIKMDCAERHRPFELCANENCKHQNNLKVNAIWERGLSKRVELFLSDALKWTTVLTGDRRFLRQHPSFLPWFRDCNR